MNTDYLTRDYLPLATWSVGGGILHGSPMLQLCEGIAKELSGIRKLSHLHATPACAWSIDWATQRPLTSPTAYVQMLEKASRLNQAICLSFDNPYVAKNALEDNYGLFLVSELLRHNPTGRNSVAVADDRIAATLRRNFPGISITAHMNRAVCEAAEPDADFYNRLLDVYDRVQLYPASGRAPRILALIRHPERCSLVVNDLCRQGSQSIHLDILLLLAQMRVRPYDFDFKVRRQELLAATLSAPGNIFSRAELQAVYNSGIRDFHIQAAQYRNGMTPAWILMSYLISAKPEHSNMRALLAYKVFCYLNGTQSPIASGLEPFPLRYPE